MLPSSVKIYQISTMGTIITSYLNGSTTGTCASIRLITLSHSAATITTTIIPALCQIPLRAVALSQSPVRMAPALPVM